jgi:hypothetical protein
MNHKKDWRSFFFALGPCLFLFSAGALAAGCSTSGSCSGSAAQIAHCQTSTGTESCPSTHSACSAQSCTGGCTGSFFLALGSAESNNDYGRTNAQGCAGQWQFCNSNIPNFGLKYCSSMENYLANVNDCQDQAAVAYQEGNLSSLESMGVTSAIGKTITVDGTSFTVTEAGLLGAAQLGGPGCAQDLVNGGGNAVDAGGTSCRKYFANFNNTTLPDQFPGASGGGSPSGCGSASPSAGGSSPSPSASPSSSPDSGLASMLPMMMMGSMMSPMMSAMSGLGSTGSSGTSPGTGASGTSTGSSLSNLVSSLGSSLSGGSSTPASATPAASPAAPTSPVAQDLDQLEQQGAQAPDPSTDSTDPAPAAAATKHTDYRLLCGSSSADTVAGCRSYVPATP